MHRLTLDPLAAAIAAANKVVSR